MLQSLLLGVELEGLLGLEVGVEVLQLVPFDGEGLAVDDVLLGGLGQLLVLLLLAVQLLPQHLDL